MARDGASSFPLLAIPLFIFAGAIMNASSISRRLIAFASALFGFIRGGLSMVVIGASMFFAEISGSAHEALLARLAAAQRDVAAAKAQLDATSVAFLKTPRSEEARAARDRAVAELAQAQRVLDAGGDRDFERESAEDDARRTRI